MERTTIRVSITNKRKSREFEFVSLLDNNNINESRANDLANIIAYDKEHYNDINVETVLRACDIAELIEETGGVENE